MVGILPRDCDYYVNVSRGHFEESCRGDVECLLETIDWCLEDCGLERSEVEVVLVGGCARVPRMRRAAREFFHGRAPREVLRPDHAAVLGASVYAASLTKGGGSGNGGDPAADDGLPFFELREIQPLSSFEQDLPPPPLAARGESLGGDKPAVAASANRGGGPPRIGGADDDPGDLDEDDLESLEAGPETPPQADCRARDLCDDDGLPDGRELAGQPAEPQPEPQPEPELPSEPSEAALEQSELMEPVPRDEGSASRPLSRKGQRSRAASGVPPAEPPGSARGAAAAGVAVPRIRSSPRTARSSPRPAGGKPWHARHAGAGPPDLAPLRRSLWIGEPPGPSGVAQRSSEGAGVPPSPTDKGRRVM